MEERHPSSFATNLLAWLESGAGVLTYGTEPLKGAKPKAKSPTHKEWRPIGKARKQVKRERHDTPFQIDQAKIPAMSVDQLAVELALIPGASRKRARRHIIDIWLSVPGRSESDIHAARERVARRSRAARRDKAEIVVAGADKATLKALPYGEFLQTDYWREVRRRVFKRDGHCCRDCATTNNLQVHHLTYEHHGEEHRYLRDLITLCRACHEQRHTTQRPSRRQKA